MQGGQVGVGVMKDVGGEVGWGGVGVAGSSGRGRHSPAGAHTHAGSDGVEVGAVQLATTAVPYQHFKGNRGVSR